MTDLQQLGPEEPYREMFTVEGEPEEAREARRCILEASRAGFVLFDYKTNASLFSEFNQRNHVMLMSPFSDLVQESIGEYTIQLSLYALMLEDIGINVLGRRIVWLKDDGTFETFALPDVSGRLRNCL